MTKIGVRELRQNASTYLKQVREGEVIEVSVRGRLVARIVPVAESEWHELMAQGHVRPPVDASHLHNIQPVQGEPETSASEVLRSMREQER